MPKLTKILTKKFFDIIICLTLKTEHVKPVRLH